jgi:hypothetical protein
MWVQTSSGTWVQVTAIEHDHREQTVHNLTIDTTHTYSVYAGADAVVTHNCGTASTSSEAYVDLASASRRDHVLDGHRFGGERGNTWFPHDWSDNMIMHSISDIATDPSLTWTQQIGACGATHTRGGAPVRFKVEGARGGIQIRVIIEPGGEGIITGFPIQ